MELETCYFDDDVVHVGSIISECFQVRNITSVDYKGRTARTIWVLCSTEPRLLIRLQKHGQCSCLDMIQ